jgi:hypothetical protein
MENLPQQISFFTFESVPDSFLFPVKPLIRKSNYQVNDCLLGELLRGTGGHRAFKLPVCVCVIGGRGEFALAREKLTCVIVRYQLALK